MKIYTRTGDKGTTSLVGGRRVSKTDTRLEAYGTVDELMAHVAYMFDMYDSGSEHLPIILDKLMCCASLLATEDTTLSKIPQITDNDILDLEKWTDILLNGLPQLQSFTLPCGTPSLSYSHVCRTVCRRAERAAIRCSENYAGQIPELVMTYLNRLSDYLYALGRFCAQRDGAKELLWKPNK